MSRRLIGGVLAALIAGQALTATPVRAATTAAPPAPVAAPLPPPTPRALALAKRYMVAVHFTDTMTRIMGPVMAQLTDAAAGESSMPASYRVAMRESAAEAMDAMIPKLVDEATPLMAQIYSEEELQGLVDFYESPVGQALIAKGPRFSAALADHLPGLQAEIKMDMLSRFCGKIKCSPDIRKRLNLPDNT